MFNLVNKILKSIYVYVGFRLPYYWAEAFCPNRTIYAAILMANCYTMKQFRNKNIRLLTMLLDMDNNEKFKLRSVRDLSNYLKSSLSEQHKDKTRNYIVNELGIKLD